MVTLGGRLSTVRVATLLVALRCELLTITWKVELLSALVVAGVV
jgi:hypothetical protein